MNIKVGMQNSISIPRKTIPDKSIKGTAHRHP